MKSAIRKLFSPILNYFESGEEPYGYKPSHRITLIVMGVLFLVLSVVSAAAGVFTAQLAAIAPFLIFFSIGLVCIVLAWVGTDRAVAKIWGTKT